MSRRPVKPRKFLLAVPVVLAMLGMSAGVAEERCPYIEPPPELENEFNAAFYSNQGAQLLDVLLRYEYTGHPEILMLLSGAYEGGYGEFPTTEARQKRALQLMTRAALCGHPHAIEALAEIFGRGGLGVQRDEAKSKCLWSARMTHASITECGIELVGAVKQSPFLDRTVTQKWRPSAL